MAGYATLSGLRALADGSPKGTLNNMHTFSLREGLGARNLGLNDVNPFGIHENAISARGSLQTLKLSRISQGSHLKNQKWGNGSCPIGYTFQARASHNVQFFSPRLGGFRLAPAAR